MRHSNDALRCLIEYYSSKFNVDKSLFSDALLKKFNSYYGIRYFKLGDAPAQQVLDMFIQDDLGIGILIEIVQEAKSES